MGIILSALMSMAAKILTSEFVEFALLKAAEILVKKTSNDYDDEFLAEIKKLLGKE